MVESRECRSESGARPERRGRPVIPTPVARAAAPVDESGRGLLPRTRSGRPLLAGQILGEGADAAQQIRRLGGDRR